MSHCFHYVGYRDLFRQVESFVQAFARPISVAQFLGSQQDHLTLLPLTLAHELLPFFVSSDTEKSQRTLVGHGFVGIRAGEYHAIGANARRVSREKNDSVNPVFSFCSRVRYSLTPARHISSALRRKCM